VKACSLTCIKGRPEPVKKGFDFWTFGKVESILSLARSAKRELDEPIRQVEFIVAIYTYPPIN
jgi:hypothetical protein